MVSGILHPKPAAQALADTFDPSIPRPSAFEPYNPAPFFAEVPP
jgi:hypothetical protein